MIEIIAIRVSNGTQSYLLTARRQIRAEDLQKYKRRLSRLYHGEVDFTYKDLTK